MKAHVWIGHQRYPTRGRVWHPGGAHPFIGLHEALVHNGDFANCHAVTEYLRQRGIVPLFVTDTEVSVLLFDLYARVLGYPLEYIINGLRFDERGEVIGLDMKYPGNNLFSLASGGACYLNDPYATVSETQLNGATFVPFRQEDWNLILPYLSMNETLFGISIRHDILMVDGVLK